MTSSPLVWHVTVAEKRLLFTADSVSWKRLALVKISFICLDWCFNVNILKVFLKYEIFLISSVTEHWIPCFLIFISYICMLLDAIPLYISSGASHWLVSSLVPFDLRLPGCFHLIVQ